jgi:two-component system, NtrC family, response regulator AtoC
MKGNCVNILLVDDDKATRDSVGLFIRNLGHYVTGVSNGREGIKAYEEGNYQLILTDIQMPHVNGFEMMREIKKSNRSMVDIVVITGHSNVNNAITALREGAYDYLQKPINIEELAIIIERISEHLALKMTNRELTNRFEERVRERVSETESKLESITRALRENIGLKNIAIHSKKLENIFKLAEKFQNSPTVSVLIEGETGTGKEILAQFIHHGYGLNPKPLVAINCAAIPAELFESELFGHEPGSFTGAGSTSKKGKLELAEDGTILLDEIGEMPLTMQSKLLRVLEEREFYRVGGVKKLPFNARVVASTNKSLAQEAKKNAFRSDLYHRLNVGYIEIPPLRERREEILPLAHDFLVRASARYGKKNFTEISPEAERILMQYHWEGNIRQLENAIERVAILYDGPSIEPDNLSFLKGDHHEEPRPAETDHRIVLDEDTCCFISEKGIDLDNLINKLVEEAMRMSSNNKTLAAKLLNISPRTISRRLERGTDSED